MGQRHAPAKRSKDSLKMDSCFSSLCGDLAQWLSGGFMIRIGVRELKKTKKSQTFSHCLVLAYGKKKKKATNMHVVLGASTLLQTLISKVAEAEAVCLQLCSQVFK